MDKASLLKLIYDDSWMMQVLHTAHTLNLPDWMIGAGFVRNKVWDHLHGFKNAEVPTDDIDLIYFDPDDLTKQTEQKYDAQLASMMDINWATKNQARMHIKHNRTKQFLNTEEALSEWVEVATCVAVRLDKNNQLLLFAPHGLDDLFNLTVRPTPHFKKQSGNLLAKSKKQKLGCQMAQVEVRDGIMRPTGPYSFARLGYLIRDRYQKNSTAFTAPVCG